MAQSLLITLLLVAMASAIRHHAEFAPFVSEKELTQVKERIHFDEETKHFSPLQREEAETMLRHKLVEFKRPHKSDRSLL